MHFVYCRIKRVCFDLSHICWVIWMRVCLCMRVCARVRPCVHVCVRTHEFSQSDLLKSITTRWIAPQSSMQKLWLFFFFFYLYFVTVIYSKEALHRLYPLTKKDSVYSTVGCEDDICTGGGMARKFHPIDSIVWSHPPQERRPWHLRSPLGICSIFDKQRLKVH